MRSTSDIGGRECRRLGGRSGVAPSQIHIGDNQGISVFPGGDKADRLNYYPREGK